MILSEGDTFIVANTTSIRTITITTQNPKTFPTLNWPATLFNNLTEGETLKIELPMELPKGRNRISLGIGKFMIKMILKISNYLSFNIV